MPFDDVLAEKLRYTRGLTVVDFSTRIDQVRANAADAGQQRREAIRNAVFDVGSPDLSEDDLVRLVSARLSVSAQHPVTYDELKEAIK